MRSSVRSRLVAATVFGLIAFVMIGGMAWATYTSFALARQSLIDNHERRLTRAVWQMDSYLTGILYYETGRSYRDYQALRRESAPVAVGRRGGIELDADYVLMASPLLTSGPEQDWIDLFFHVSAFGEISSPQINDEEGMWALENKRVSTASWPRAKPSMDWLKSVLPTLDLPQRVADGLQGYRGPCLCEDATSPSCCDRYRAVGAEGEPAAIGREFRQRKSSLRDTQISYVPKPACVDDQEADQNVRRFSPLTRQQSSATEGQLEGGVQITTDPLVPFWLPPAPDGSLKLAFVRECHADADVFHQGFVADWNRLKTPLMAASGDWPEDASLEPVLHPESMTAEASRYHLSNVPVRLQAPSIPKGANAAAWEEVRVTLIGSWMTAAAVLLIAGIGLKNLVALTERRMNFAYAVTHELRTPLTTFRLYTDMLTAGLVPPEKTQEYLATLNRESSRLGSLVEDVLEYARLENQKIRLNPTAIDGNALLDVIGETLHKRCADTGVDSKTENALSNGHTIRTDVDVLNRVAAVLINNACRHARSGANGTTVLVRLTDDDRAVHLDVIDTGPGVDRRDARAIFKPFRRGRGADAAAQGGIGLGLALARSWAGLLGGCLELAARHHPQYGGAHFRLTIPASLRS